MSTPERQAISAACFAQFVNELDYLHDADLELVRRAYAIADQAHATQTRKSGEPYITHPIAVATQCARWKLDAQALMAALLHDTIEDCESINKAYLAETLGSTVANLVDGLTKLEKIKFSSRQENQAESFRKMLLATSSDVRVILVKLADRLHNMRTMEDMKPESQHRISTETMQIYAPIADRLGMNAVYRELQDLAFKYRHPWRYATLAKAIPRARARRSRQIEEVRHNIQAALAAAGVQAHIYPVEKTVYATYNKMLLGKRNFAQLHDTYGFVIVVPDNANCYLALGILHALYKPVPQRMRDFIATPKSNGYQSLHTRLIGPVGTHIGVQIRTDAMHQTAELGITNHWIHANHHTPSGISPAQQAQESASWIQNLLHIQQENKDPHEFFAHVQANLSLEDIFVFSPQNQTVSLPHGSTIVDFAYAIDSDMGDQATSALVNNRPVPLRTQLHGGDVVQVITDPQSSPSPTWLDFVKTARARSRIRHHLRSQSYEAAQQLGQQLLANAYRTLGMGTLPDCETQPEIWAQLVQFAHSPSIPDLLADIGQGKRLSNVLAQHLATLMQAQGQRPDTVLLSMERFKQDDAYAAPLALDGSKQNATQYASCCHPLPGDAIVGYLKQGQGLVIHQSTCPTAQHLRKTDAERFVNVEWAEQTVRPFASAITITVQNHMGVIAEVTTAIARAKANIGHISTNDDMAQEVMNLHLVLQVRHRQHMEHVIRTLQRLRCVVRIQPNTH